jgi:hypothetical protein
VRSVGGILGMLLMLWCAAPQAGAQVVVARATTDSTNFLVGDAIRVHVLLLHPKGMTFQPLVADTLGSFFVIERQPFRPQNDTQTATEYVVAKYDSGEAFLPPLVFLYSVPGDTVSRRVETNPVRLTVHTVPVDTSKEIRDLKPPLSIPISLAEVLLILGIVFLVALLAYVGYRFWKKRKSRVAGEVSVVPPRAAHVIALDELGRLKEKRLWQQGLIKQFYSEATEIFRRYIENRYRQEALEQTTDEIVSGLLRLKMPGDLVGRAEETLRRADLVKFAKQVPGIPEHEQTLKFVYDFVDRTKIVESASGSNAPAGVKTHVGA